MILDILEKPEETDKSKERRLVPVPGADMAPRSMGQFRSTKFYWVNGKSVQEQITSLPDGGSSLISHESKFIGGQTLKEFFISQTFEKRLTTTEPNGETNTVISQHTAEEVMPQRGGSGRGFFGGEGGFGGSPFW